MSTWKRLPSATGGRRLVVGSGALYLLLAICYPVLPGVDGTSPAIYFVFALLAGGPGLVLLVGGYRLPGTDVRPEFYPTIAGWCFGGIATMLGIVGITALAADSTNLVANGIILTALGSAAGFIVGTYDARAKTRQRDLEETVAELRTTNERLEQFAYATSHDLQEPLRMVSSYLQLLEKRYRDDLDEDAREFIDFAVDGADRMRVMVASLLEYSRVTDRGQPLEPTDVEAVLDGTIADMEPLIAETDATITADDLPTVPADADQLGQVFRNLLSNAIAHRGEAPPTVHVSADRSDDAWRFSVADEGIGIDEKYHDRIFEVFEQLGRGRGDTGGGIGLALCERIVERHGGEIWVDSEEGQGATFHFTVADPGTDAGQADHLVLDPSTAHSMTSSSERSAF